MYSWRSVRRERLDVCDWSHRVPLAIIEPPWSALKLSGCIRLDAMQREFAVMFYHLNMGTFAFALIILTSGYACWGGKL